jgi:hypothetical protein
MVSIAGVCKSSCTQPPFLPLVSIGDMLPNGFRRWDGDAGVRGISIPTISPVSILVLEIWFVEVRIVGRICGIVRVALR